MQAASASVARTEHFPSKDGTQLFGRFAAPAGKPRAVVVIVHGYGEHSGRYAHVVDYLVATHGYAVYSFDYRGHGQAEGKRGHCAHFVEFLDDLDAACARARDAAPGLPLALFGHSHGGLVVLRALAEPGRTPAGVAAAALSSPFLGLAIKVPALKLAAGKLASRIYPALAMPNGIDARDTSHDESVIAAYSQDPLNHHVATARWFTEATAAQAYVVANAGRVELPTLWLIGGDDHIADPSAARGVAASVGGAKEINVYEGLYHEIVNELPADRAKVLGDLGQWLDGRFPAR